VAHGFGSNPGPATLRHHDATLGSLPAAGFSVAMTAHADALLDAYAYGFTLQEAALPFKPETTAEATATFTRQIGQCWLSGVSRIRGGGWWRARRAPTGSRTRG